MPTMWLTDMQKIGIACCSGGGFFFIGGVVLFFDRAMLAMGNTHDTRRHTSQPRLNNRLPFDVIYQILFLLGLTLIIGLQKTALFFARRQKWKGTAAFAAGVALILLRWPLIGFVVELYGIFVLFGDFFATIAGFMGNVPVVGPYIATALERMSSGGRRNADLPV
ncbi:Golgi Transport [Coniosporium apollinis]|uniref:Golgi Transport n=2 Tax=Coniosporium TaxID=2810619 RepID=A0ABQ9NUL8_9PEZI|nr:Golgi Transport [Cladosporium sp. JES 115]KAJ9663576.1 Golgi Transport [Coniosporium apollinis]